MLYLAKLSFCVCIFVRISFYKEEKEDESPLFPAASSPPKRIEGEESLAKVHVSERGRRRRRRR